MEGTSLFNDHLLFAPLNLDVNLSPSHPEQVQIFRLWQIYMDNVNPLLKVTHTPTLQPRIIDAASDVANISPALEALMLSIYCISVVSLDEGGCIRLFRSPRNQLLAGYQSACQQALLKCSLWRSCDVDGLTALYLYLVSVAGQTDARCLACMLVVAMRIAQRMGIHNESTNTECTVLEAEMRRRLWWSLVAFDYRISELTDYKTTTLIPTWDCSTPLNVNDFELRPDMKKAPVVHEKPTEALFCVVRSELADFVRHSPFHLDFVNPSLNSIAQPKATFHGPSTGGGELVALGKLVEDKYLAFCDVEDQLHYMTIWTTRGSLARSRLLDHYSKLSKSSVPETDAQRSAGISYALSMLECDMKLRTSPLTKGYLWFVGFYLPALAYLYTLNHLRKWPDSDHSAKAWAAIGENYEALTMNQKRYEQSERGIYVHKFSQVVLQAWEARETLLKQQHKPLEPVPQIVLDIGDGCIPRGRVRQVGRCLSVAQCHVG
ncbi:putative C6 transcription factor [Thelonectria olida]|uniref:C6 transcription factor n=1 Tax=Thelonectria olida TaxID=1576542 RepID=A0A9P8W0T2_9HYPO|nr:putative C6 transcription factor [Thelonectria olida]